MPGSVYRNGGMIGVHSTSLTAGPSFHLTTSVVKKKNSLNQASFQSLRNLWPTTNGDLSVIDSLTYYWDAGVIYSYPQTGGSTLYDLRGGRQYLYSNNGTFAGNVVYNSLGGGSLLLDGTGDWIASFSSSFANVSSRTAGIIFRPTATGSQGLIGNRTLSSTGWSLMINRASNGQLNMVHCNGVTQLTFDVAAGITTNTWYHATYTYNRAANDCYLYLNGTSIGSNLNYGVDTSSAFNGVIGARGSDFAVPFTGYIGLAYVASTDFSSSQITDLHNIFKGRFGI